MIEGKSGKKTLILELILNEFAKRGYQCLIMNQKGEIIVTSEQPPAEEDQRLTQKLIEVSDFTTLIGRSPEDIVFNLKDRRLYFQKIYTNKTPTEDLYIAIVFPASLRTYRRTIKQVLHQLKPFLR